VKQIVYKFLHAWVELFSSLISVLCFGQLNFMLHIRFEVWWEYKFELDPKYKG
jgi:hypothetical protein